MKRQMPLIIIFTCGMFMVVQYFVPHEKSEFLYEFIALDWPPIIGIFALLLGVISLTRVSLTKIRRKSEDWGYSVVTLIGLFFMSAVGIIGHYHQPSMDIFDWQFNNIMIPISATMFSLLAFFIASAAYRAFRARSVLATILLLAAIAVMIRFFPLGPLTGPVGDLSGWILNVPNMAAKRAILIGVGLGIVSTAMKVILGIERSYLGRD
jgi:hypothetical protein